MEDDRAVRTHCTSQLLEAVALYASQRWLFMAESSRKKLPQAPAETDTAFGCLPGQMPCGCSRFVRPVCKSIVGCAVNTHSLRRTSATFFDKVNLNNDERRYLDQSLSTTS